MTDPEHPSGRHPSGRARGAGGFGWAEVREMSPGAGLAAALEARSPATLEDDEVIDAVAAYKRQANADEARMLDLMRELDVRRGVRKRDCRDGRDITSRSQTATEVGAATRESEYRTHGHLRLAEALATRLPRTADLLRRGRISLYQATLVVEAIDRLVDEQLTDAVEARIIAAITRDNTDCCALAAATPAELRKIAKRAVSEAEPGRHEERSKRAFADRGVRRTNHDDGMATLTITHSSVDIEAAYHRMGLITKGSHVADDPRTLDQHSADLVLAMLRGDARVETPTSRLEDGEPADLQPTGTSAVQTRIYITMTAATAAGFSDQPGRLQGGELVPAWLARRIAYQPNSTWYRMLTDEAGHLLELSSDGYQPGAPLSRSVQALHQTCVQVGCQRPAEACEGDHEVPWPLGATEQANLSPKCRRHHTGKTAGRFHSAKLADGTIVWRYPTGHTYSKSPPRHPVDRWPTDWVEPDSLTQIQHGLSALRREQDAHTRLEVDACTQRLRHRHQEQLLECWRAMYPDPDPDPEPPDPQQPEMTVEDYDTIDDVLAGLPA